MTNQAADLGGELVLTLDGLAAGIIPTEVAGVTGCASPAGSPYVSLAAGSDGVLSTGESTAVTLQFTNPSNQTISYGSRALAGPGAKEGRLQ